VAMLGGPPAVLQNAGMQAAPVIVDVPAPQAGVLSTVDVRALGLVVVALGGGRQQASDLIDMRVGLSHVLAPGATVQAGQPLARVHASSADAAAAAVRAVGLAVRVVSEATAAIAASVCLQVIESSIPGG
jgi:thymidine phosphorylase